MSAPSSLPRLRGRQREVLYLPAEGNIVVLGTAGSGKTTLAVYRSLHLSDPSTEHCGSTLLVTYNRSLVTYLKHLLGNTGRPTLDIENYHSFARGYLSSRGKLPDDSICTPRERLRFIETAIHRVRADGEQSSILNRPIEFFDEEFEWIQNHGIKDGKSYVQSRRVGRTATRIARDERHVVANIYKHYLAERERNGKQYDWSGIASSVLKELSSDREERRYRHVIIDEGQDFSPEMLRSLTALVPEDGSLTFFGDMAQQIYGRRMSWRDAGFNNVEIWRFKENYRNTKQISRLALALADMPDFSDDPDLVEPTAPPADGPLPALVQFSGESKEANFVVLRATEPARTQTVAILCRTKEQENFIRRYLPDGAMQIGRNMKRWPSGPRLFYGTYHSAKGLEFDSVFLPFLSEQHWPNSSDVEALGPQEAAAKDSLLLYVGITRARATLVLTYSGKMTKLLPRNGGLYRQ